jgi:molybdate transport system substrate-binding protein
MKVPFLYKTFLIVIGTLAAWSCAQPKTQVLTIAAAANVQYALDSLVSVFEKDTGLECEIVISSSGKLTAQISKGAPYDIFLSADMKYPEVLYKDGFVKQKPVIYAHGSLVLWRYASNSEVDLWQLITSDEVASIAIANPKTAPYGTATMEALNSMNLLDSVERKLIYGESVAQTNHFITSGAAGLGFTAKSVVMTHQMRDKGHWTDVDLSYYTPIDQGMAVINHEGYEVPAAQLFYDFMLSPKAQSILQYFGYQTPK